MLLGVLFLFICLIFLLSPHFFTYFYLLKPEFAIFAKKYNVMRNTILFLLFQVVFFHLSAQEFKNILDEQLSSKQISDIYQDRDGFIWVATDKGINRFDGNKVISFAHEESDSLSLANDLTYAVYEDRQGNFYVGHYFGVQVFNKKTNKFSKVALYSDGRSLRETVNGFCELSDGTVYSYGDNANKVTIADGQPILEPIEWDIDASGVFRIACDNLNNIWVLKRDVGLYKIRNGKSRLITEMNDGNMFIYDFHLIDGIIYIVSTSNDVYQYNVYQDRIVKVNTEPISKASIRYLTSYDNDEILVCTDGNGFKLMNIETGKIRDFYLNIPLLTSNHLKPHKVIKDRNGNLCISLYQKGMAMISSSHNFFRYIGYKSLLNNIIGNSPISAIDKDSNGNIWVGTDGDGIYKMNKEGTSSYHYEAFADGGTAPSIIKTIFADSKGDVWIGTYGNGIGKISAKSNQYQSYEKVFSKKGKVSTRIYDIIEDDNRRLWVSSLGDGIYCYDLEKEALIDVSRANDVLNKWQTTLLHTSNNYLYVGTFDGLFSVDLNSDSLQTKQLFRRTVINSLYEDSKGRIWAGDNNGLMRVDTTGILKYYSAEEGLQKVSVNSINEGNNNSLWLATEKGLVNYFPEDGQCYRYTTNEGLQNIDFAKSGSFTDATGAIWFAGDYGITTFVPQNLETSKKLRHVRVIDFLINDESITTETLSGGEPIIEDLVWNSKEFHLSQENNSFAIEFGTHELEAPKYAEWYYMLDNGAWKTVQQGSQKAFFNNLSRGTHTIKFKLVDNLVESDIQEIKVIVRPYWWLSIWAIIAYIILFFAAVYYVYKQIHYRFLVKKMDAIHQRETEINEAKLQFFTNISHEIKTPLTLIVSPLQKLISSDEDQKRQTIYKTMQRNSMKLVQLINELLDLRKLDNGRLKLTFRNMDIIAKLNDLCSYFHVVSDSKNISLSFAHSDEELWMWIDSSYFEKIFMNLLSNAFKFTPSGGTIALSATKIDREGKSFARIEVKDNGKGIAEGDLTRIFERFYIAQNNVGNGSSNGIGLHLTKSLVELHHGTIIAQNNTDGPGACFVVELPLGKEHFRDDETLLETVVPEKDEIMQYNVLPEDDDEQDARSQTSRTMLVVDDEPEIVNYLRKELSQDFHIISCSNGKEALQQVFNKQPDIIISDVMMPEMDGITFCKKIKQNVNFNHIPIILLSAKADEETNLQGLKYGADAYITKPFYSEVLRRTALNLVNLRSTLHNIYTGQQTQEDRQVKIEMESPNQKLLDRIMRVVNNNIDNPELSIDMLCEEVGISRAHIYRKLKELTNQSGRDFIKNIRLNYAEKLLLKDNYSIGEIAEKVGFTKISNFSATFKEKNGLSPLQWREAQKNARMNGNENMPSETE